MINKRLLTPKEVSEYLGIKEKTLYKWVYEKKIPYVKLSHKVLRFDKEKIDMWIEEKMEEPLKEEMIDRILNPIYNRRKRR